MNINLFLMLVFATAFKVHAKEVNARLAKQFMPIWALRAEDVQADTDPTSTTTSGDQLGEEEQEQCQKSADFKGFTGMTAMNTADCAWDYFACSSSLKCCQERYRDCCMFTMDPEGFMEQFEASLSEANVQETDEEVEAEEVEDAAETPFRHADTLIGCIWQFNGCVEHQMPEELCRERWTECKMIIMGMGAANQDAGYPDRPTGSVVSTTVVEESEESPFRTWVQYPIQSHRPQQPVVFVPAAPGGLHHHMPRPFGYSYHIPHPVPQFIYGR